MSTSGTARAEEPAAARPAQGPGQRGRARSRARARRAGPRGRDRRGSARTPRTPSRGRPCRRGRRTPAGPRHRRRRRARPSRRPADRSRTGRPVGMWIASSRQATTSAASPSATRSSVSATNSKRSDLSMSRTVVRIRSRASVAPSGAAAVSRRAGRGRAPRASPLGTPGASRAATGSAAGSAAIPGRPQRVIVWPSGPGKAATRSAPGGAGGSPSATRCAASAAAIDSSRIFRPPPSTTIRSQACSTSVITCDEQDRRRALGADLVDQDVEELAPRERVEARQRLVEDEDRGVGPERQRQHHLRLLPAGQRPGVLVERDVELVEPALGERSVEAAAQHAGELDVVRDREPAVQRRPLRDVAEPIERRRPIPERVDAEDGHGAGARALEPDPGLHQGGLAGPVRTDERGDAADRDVEVDPVERPDAAAIALGDRASGESRPATPAAGPRRARTVTP